MSVLMAKKEEQAMPDSQDNPRCLSDNIRQAMENYFTDLEGHDASNLYELFLAQFEKPLFEVVMQNTRGNITHAAKILGLNRGTLRNRLKKYGLD